MKKIYKGYLKLKDEGEGYNILFVTEIDEPLAEEIQTDIAEFGKYLTVRYFLSSKEETLEGLQHILVNQILGIGEADYGHAYSEYTGYLWTDEKIEINGHDLLEELKSSIGRYLYLEIEYHKEPQEN